MWKKKLKDLKTKKNSRNWRGRLLPPGLGKVSRSIELNALDSSGVPDRRCRVLFLSFSSLNAQDLCHFSSESSSPSNPPSPRRTFFLPPQPLHHLMEGAIFSFCLPGKRTSSAERGPRILALTKCVSCVQLQSIRDGVLGTVNVLLWQGTRTIPTSPDYFECWVMFYVIAWLPRVKLLFF